MNQKALFLDRDGVINVDMGYVHKVTDFHFINGIFSLCQKAIFKDYLIIVITNQAGIGRGIYTLDHFNILTEWMCETFLANNILITKVYQSPFHPIYGLGDYKRDHEMRKPRPGMINKAQVEYGLDLGNSVLRREFLHVDEMAAASLFVLNLPKQTYDENTDPMLSHINVGTGVDISILELAQLVAKVTGFTGRISTDPTKPDGAMRKLMDVGRLSQMGWSASIELEQGLTNTYEWYLANAQTARA